LQLTAFGARDRAHFESFCSAPRRQLKRNTLGSSPVMSVPNFNVVGISVYTALLHWSQEKLTPRSNAA
jgi:hypothetical protein